MDMTDAEIRKVFDDPVKALQIMRLGHEVEFAAAQCRKNLLADAIWHSFNKPNPEPVRKVLEMVLSYYDDDPEALVAMFGEELINNIKNALSNEQ